MNQKLSISKVKRIIAYFIDMYLSDLVFTIPVITFTSIEAGTLMVENYISNLDKSHAIMAFLLGLVLVFLYFYFMNWLGFKGQTPGKFAMRIKVARTDGKDVTALDVFMRYIVGFIFIENTISIIGFSFRSLLGMFIPFKIVNDIYYIYVALTAISIFVMFRNPLGQMLHDLISKTFVCEAKTRGN